MLWQPTDIMLWLRDNVYYRIARIHGSIGVTGEGKIETFHRVIIYLNT